MCTCMCICVFVPVCMYICIWKGDREADTEFDNSVLCGMVRCMGEG